MFGVLGLRLRCCVLLRFGSLLLVVGLPWVFAGSWLIALGLPCLFSG